MNAIRVRKTIDSETLCLPELAPFMGHTVDIVIEDRAGVASEAVRGTGDWAAFRRAVLALRESYDFDAVAEQDARDMLDAQNQAQ